MVFGEATKWEVQFAQCCIRLWSTIMIIYSTPLIRHILPQSRQQNWWFPPCIFNLNIPRISRLMLTLEASGHFKELLWNLTLCYTSVNRIRFSAIGITSCVISVIFNSLLAQHRFNNTWIERPFVEATFSELFETITFTFQNEMHRRSWRFLIIHQKFYPNLL